LLVRAVCYQLFTLGLIESMSKNETNKVSRLLTAARVSRRIPWEWIVDETREREVVPSWDDPVEFGRAITSQYRKNKWAGQPIRIEVWSEKSTVRGTLAPVLDEFEVGFVSVHGYSSATAIQNLVVERLRSPKPLVILYVGDWDCSGVHMSEEDLPARAEAYTTLEVIHRCRVGGERVPLAGLEIRRLALTEADVSDPDLPSFAASTKGPSDKGKGDPGIAGSSRGTAIAAGNSTPYRRPSCGSGCGRRSSPSSTWRPGTGTAKLSGWSWSRSPRPCRPGILFLG
jgi:hypothetical protein